ncbi:hypothetical protein LBMAG20_01610 [Methylocystaceae bacterium]|nr:hypothetical protein LBMAG20_01610 [Methylocystaceae bacterium]
MQKSMKDKYFIVIFLAHASLASAQDHPIPPANPDCAAQAINNKIEPVSINSFMKKCENEMAQRNCETAAVDKKITGKAKIGFIKSCVKDAAHFQ